MANVSTSGTAANVLTISASTFLNAEIASLNYFSERFQAAEDDIYWGYGYAYVYNKTKINAYTYTNYGTIALSGTDFDKSAGTINAISYSDSDGRFSLSGSLSWRNGVITGGKISRISAWDGTDGFLLSGNMALGSNGYIRGSVTTYRIYAQNLIYELGGNINVSNGTGSINKISVTDGESSLLLTGSFSYATYLEALAGTTRVSEIFDIQAFFVGNDTFKVNYAGREWHGFSGHDTITGDSGNDRLYGDEGDDKLYGLSGNDHLEGGTGNDLLDGGIGADTMIGGSGNDAYFVDNINDVVTEDINLGTDTVNSFISYILGNNLENLVLLGADHIDATGNDFNNNIIGNSGNNIIDGGLGSDTMSGGKGHDTYIIDNVADLVIEAVSSGIDTVRSSVSFTLGANLENLEYLSISNGVLTGNTSANELVGNAGDDTLDGKSGADRMVGGEGDDVYYVDNIGDTVVELTNEGEDIIYSTISYILGSNVEHGVLLGSASINLTGNVSDNELIGNTGSNTLDGGHGEDAMIGGKGNDIYIVDDVGDVVTELLNEGTDTVRTSVSHFLGYNLENIVLTGSNHISGKGNDHNNIVTGNSGDNTLEGGGGIDTLSGGIGNDTYIVNLLVNGVSAVKIEDKIIEFANAGIDTVQLVSGTLSVNSTARVILANYFENLDASGTGVTPLTLHGNTASNIILGNSGNNILDGLGGIDTLIGGDGDDVYIVDNKDDGVIENFDEGSDTLRVAYRNSNILAFDINLSNYSSLENIEITGAGKFNLIGDGSDNVLTGNTSANELVGNAGDDTLDGKSGADRMVGGEGDDVYYVDNIGDTVVELTNEGEDIIYSTISYILGSNVEHGVLLGSASINLTGNVSDNELIGNTGSNTLDGGHGEDAMIGGKGNDIYIVDDVGDVVTELLNEGTDTVRSSISYALGENLENLALTGISDINATGNSQNNVIIGNSGANALEGGTGVDRLSGGLGNDTYVVNLLSRGNSSVNIEDSVIEYLNGGIDTLKLVSGTLVVNSSASVVLANYLENLDASDTGITPLTLKGNKAANTIIGNAGNNTLSGMGGDDVLYGGAGDDILIGGSGEDVFMFDSSYIGYVDTIRDFSLLQNDKIDLSALLYNYDPLTDVIADFVQITISGADSVLGIDHDGGGDDFTQIAILTGVNGMSDLSAIIASGNLVVS